MIRFRYQSVVLVPTNNQMGLVAIPPKKIPPSPTTCPNNVRQNRAIRGFSRKANNRLKVALQTIKLDSSATLAVTLPFKPGTSPKQAKQLFSKLRKWMIRNYNAYGIYTIEFKNRKDVHYHLVVSFRSSNVDIRLFCLKLKKRWLEISLYPDANNIYATLVRNRESWLRYLAKCDDQRRVPANFSGAMTRFWGEFGLPPLNSPTILPIASDNQTMLRELLADIVGSQNHFRSGAISAAIRHSSGKLFVWLTKDQLEELRILLNEQIAKEAVAAKAC